MMAHDGFTLRDLVSYDERHNLANGEDNRDGHGAQPEPQLRRRRRHRRRRGAGRARAALQRALLATLLLSQGTPMLLAGDELGHTQRGNNNAYCQDNETTWLDWSQRRRRAGRLRRPAAGAAARGGAAAPRPLVAGRRGGGRAGLHW